MLSFDDQTSLRAALTLPFRVDLKNLLHKRIDRIFDDGLADHTHLVVVTAEDTEAALQATVGFSPLEQDGLRFGSLGFTPRVDVLHDHGGFFEWTVCVGNSGFAFMLLIEDRESTNGLAALCQSVLRAVSSNDHERRRQ